MPLRRFGLATVALVVALVLGAGWASASEHEAGTLTTQLQPGWNMAGWLGPDAPVSELFEAVPALERVYAWDSAHERYQRALPNTTPRHGLRRLKTGMGLWLRVGGDSAVEWTRPVSEGHVLLSLPAGRHLVGWTGRDGEAFADSAGRFGDALIEASRWNAETQQYDRYRSDAEDSANTLRELSRGDALWLDLAGDVRWWQSGLAGTTFEFRDHVSEARQASLRADMASVLAFVAERYGITPPQFAVRVEPSFTDYANANGQRIALSSAAAMYAGGDVLAHEYVHILQGPLGRLGPPGWMTEGTATYVSGLFQRALGLTTGEALRRARWRSASTVSEPLSGLERIRLFYVDGWPTYNLGALAMEWLEGRAVTAANEAEFAPLEAGWPDSLTDAGTYMRFYQVLPSSESWQKAFETAFGITVDDFYEAFAEYRSALYASPAASPQ